MEDYVGVSAAEMTNRIATFHKYDSRVVNELKANPFDEDVIRKVIDNNFYDINTYALHMYFLEWRYYVYKK